MFDRSMRVLTISFFDKAEKTQLSHCEIGKYVSLSDEFIPSLDERFGDYCSRIRVLAYCHPE
jgi:hypothetical protein